MKKFLNILLILAVFIFAFPFVKSKVYASSRTVRVTTLNPAKEDVRDFFLVYGEMVEVTGEVNGDVYAFGSQVYIDAVVNGDVLAAGGTVNFSGEATQDVRIAGAQVVIGGTVGRNLTVASADLQILKTSRVYGGLAGAAGNILLDAAVEGEVKLAGGSVNLSNFVGSNVEVWGDSVRLSPGCFVEGDLTYYSKSDAQLDKNASVSGKIIRGVVTPKKLDQADFKPLKRFFGKLRIYSTLISFLSALLIGVMLIRFFPSCTFDTASIIGKKLGKVALAGFLFLILTPIVVFLVFITVIGMPIALISIFAYLLFVHLSKVYFSFWLGITLTKRFIKNNYLSFCSGLFILYLLKLVSPINFLVSLVSLILGLGAIVLSLKELYQKALKANLV